ncbi:Crp/Fnr family transcriptional regulator [Paenibacillus glycinis]|uniref:Helix-turn-helix domain-containing protein n=1 Tax=Paenibacillus glycinis TaxID=2697035 RepID=A0ABW9XZ43_9BACL|nr:Crp/Fnr family transcriptional regulator [Paenibacillus glycinis]NBD27998.1 helix-turn-helix domain-containing protein [Paenibacillus glycinis]
MIQSEDVKQILSFFPSMADIKKEDWNQSGINLIQMEPNYIIKEGQLLEYVIMILDGTVRMYKTSSNGREITLYRVYSGECCPLMTSSILSMSEFEASACVETTGLALMIPADIFRDWVDRYSKFRQFIFKSLAKRIITLATLLDSVYFKTIRGRVAEFLIQLSDKTGKADTLHITHDSLSVELGTAREVISRTLKYLENEDVIKLSRGKITIISRGALEDCADW